MKIQPQKQLILFIALLALLPLLLLSIFFINKKNQTTLLEQKLQTVTQNILTQQKKQRTNRNLIAFYKNADHFYIDKQIETIVLLQPEIEKLKELVSNKSYAGDKDVAKRLEQLTGPSNKIAFTEGNIETTPFFQETIETLIRPVEVNVDDLKHILSKCDGVSFGSFVPAGKRPHLIILDCKLTKKSTSQTNEVFELNLKILKREYL